MTNYFDLTDKVALVTGASSGLGRDAALAFADQGADLVLVARRKERLEEVAKSIESKGRRAVVAACDVADEQQVQAAVQAGIDAFGRIDILLNNAGVATRGEVDALKTEDWRHGMDVNVTSIFLACKYVVPHMKAHQYGKIINIASINAVMADKDPALARHTYNASKAAVRGLTMGMAASYAPYNITVNSVGPGLFETEMTENTLFSSDYLNFYNQITPAGRPGKQGELNGTLIYLASDASSYVTSQHILVDGGVTIV